ncbi:MAG TPA: efflux RND transporter periplasmic adaptor subunit [Gemmataceae bacterium]|nr:efflux RND transporter periplasmic adaptor subunit [Gemmataceae bacterium]
MSDQTNNHAPAGLGARAERAAALKERVRSLRLPDEPPPARGTGLPWALCLLLAAACATLAYLAFGRTPPDAARGAPAADRPAAEREVRTAAGGEVVVESQGYVVPTHQILVSPKVSGMITKLYIQEGDRVEQGKVLAELETVDYKADYDRALATAEGAWQRWYELCTGYRKDEIVQAKAELDEADALRERLLLDYRRHQRLQNTSAVAARDYEEAQSSYRSQDRKVARLRAALRLMVEGARAERIQAAYAEYLQAEADLDKARWRLDNCVISAPISGTILTKKAEIGNLVNPIAFNGSFSICEMADLSDLEVDLSIQEREIAKVKVNQRCRIRPEAFPNRPYNGVVSRLMPIADQAKGSVTVRVKIDIGKDQPGEYLKPQMRAQVSFLKD